MKNSLLLFLFMILSFPHPLAAQAVAPSPAVVLTHVTVIDVVVGSAKPDLTVIIAGDHIDAIGKEDEVQVPQGAQVIDAGGKYLIPGLWDMHVHLLQPRYRDTFLPLLIANGVTGVRDMGSRDTDDESSLDLRRRWRREVAQGKLFAPRILSAGKIVNGMAPALNSILARDEVDGRCVVRRLKNDGADFVKVYDFLKREVYFAIMDEAKKQGMSVAGHVPISITVAEASDAGQKSVEHLTDFLWACSTAEAELRKSFTDIWNDSNPKLAFRTLWGEQLDTLLSTYSEKKEADLFAHFKRNGTWQVPTLVASRSTTGPGFLKDPMLKYIPPCTKADWRRQLSYEPVDDKQSQAIFEKYVKIVGALNRAEVPLLAGTDLGVAYLYPGSSLHDELALFVRAGLTPAEALRTATINPAKYFNLENTLGTIETGKSADLVLLDANPLTDIDNTRKIAAVILGGRYLPTKRLQKMLADAEVAASKPCSDD